MAWNCVLFRRISQPLPHLNFVRNMVTIRAADAGYLNKHLCSVHSVAQDRSSAFLIPTQLPLKDVQKTPHNSNDQEQRQLLTRPQHFQRRHTRNSLTSGLLALTSLPQLNTCSTRRFHLDCHLMNESETKTTSSMWIRPNAKPRQRSRDIVFTEKILETLCPPEDGVVLDLTFGSGGHTEEILKRNPGVRVIAVDRDPVTKIRAEELRALYPNRLCFLNIKFSNVPDALETLGVYRGSLWGAVLDAGPSYEQLTLPERGGCCATTTEKLDLRMDGSSSKSLSGLDVLQNIDYDALRVVLRSYGQSKHASKVADAIIGARYQMVDIRSAADLINFVSGVLGGLSDGDSGPLDSGEQQQGGQAQQAPKTNVAESAEHIPATAARILQALRILVNNELNELECAMRVVHYFLRPNAPFAVITYNALEHTIVKRHFTGRNVDTSVNQIGRPQHRSAKVVGTAAPSDDYRPWIPKGVLVTRWGQPVKHPHWKNAELRLARKNAAASYDIQTKAEATR